MGKPDWSPSRAGTATRANGCFSIDFFCLIKAARVQARPGRDLFGREDLRARAATAETASLQLGTIVGGVLMCCQEFIHDRDLEAMWRCEA